MYFLKDAKVQDIKRLLELFPATILRNKWSGVKGTKEEICFAAASEQDIPKITNFLNDHLSCCKQHIYIFSHDTPLNSLPVFTIQDGEEIFKDSTEKRTRKLYIVKLKYNVVLKDPLEEAVLEFLLPICLDFIEQHLIVKFVTHEKSIGSYFEGRSYYMDSRSTDEKAILQILNNAMGEHLLPTDLHKGVKKLWEDGFMDSPKTQYKKAISTSSEAMDEDKGIKEFYPEIYATVSDSLLLSALFIVTPRKDGFSVTAFSMEPSKGTINFPRYSDRPGDTDYVVNEILRHN